MRKSRKPRESKSLLRVEQVGRHNRELQFGADGLPAPCWVAPAACRRNGPKKPKNQVFFNAYNWRVFA
jgi:hypothetical protein